MHIPSPFDGGRAGVGVDKKELGPPPLNLLPRGEERFLGMCLKMLEINSQNSMCKNKIVSVI
jgi:hypothetical protein